MTGWLAFAILAAFALGYAAHLLLGVYAPRRSSTKNLNAIGGEEWTDQVMGFDTVYNVRKPDDE